MEVHNKIVNFECWCPKCLYRKSPADEDPCNECLTQPVNEDSTKPINFKETDKKK